MKSLFAILGVMFAGLVAYAMSQQSIGEGFQEMKSNIWAMVTLADLYLGFFVFIFIIFRSSESKLKASLWSFGLLILGNPVAVIYLLLKLKNYDFSTNRSINA